MPILRASDRSALRRSVRTDCQVVAEAEFQLLGVRTIDLSTEGLLLETELVDDCVGMPVLVSLRAPGTRLWLDAEGIVVRTAPARRMLDRIPAFGVRFERMDTIDRSLLASSLRGHPPPIPRRPIRRDYAKTVSLIWTYSRMAAQTVAGVFQPSPFVPSLATISL